MRKWLLRFGLLLLIGAAAYSLESRLDFWPAIAQGGEHDSLSSLELKIAEHFQNHDEHFTLTYSGDKDVLADKMTEVIRAALRRDDYSAYILNSYVYTIRSWSNQSTISIEAKYRETKEETAAVDEHVAKTIAQIIEPGMNDHEKVKQIHDWVVSTVEYDQTLTNYTAYSALTTGFAVCQGYSLLTYKLMEKAGIPVLIAEGSVNTGEHAWNMVQLDGVWYHIDTTWNDPVVKSSGDGVAILSNDASKPIRYNYYLKTDDELRTDHKWTREYPKADTSYIEVITELAQGGVESDNDMAERFMQLKKQLGLHWLDSENSIYSAGALRALIQGAIKMRETSLQFRYTPGEGSFVDSLREAFEGTHIPVGYKVSYEPFNPDGSLLVSIQLNYSTEGRS